MSGLADITSLIPDERPPETTVTSSNALITVQYNITNWLNTVIKYFFYFMISRGIYLLSTCTQMKSKL